MKPSKTFVEIAGQDLESGRLGRIFRDGAKVAVLRNDPRVGRLWAGFLPNVSERDNPAKGPWERSIFNVAPNHKASNLDVGEMLRFSPDVYGHFARKMRIFPGADGMGMQADPEYFLDGDARVTYSQDLLRSTWELMSEVFHSVLPTNVDTPSYAVAVEILKYPSSPAELESIFMLLRDAAGGWTRLGQKLDMYKGRACGLFTKGRLGDVFALACLVPGLAKLLARANARQSQFRRNQVPTDSLLVGNVHVDGSKVISGLLSVRDRIRTEVYDGQDWVELSLTPQTLAVFPSGKISDVLDVVPTEHRVLMNTQDNRGTSNGPNLTLSLAIVSR